MARYNPRERVGVSAVSEIVASELEWIFREQLVADMGIDAQIELVEPEGHPTGKLIGVQIKTGSGNFTDTGGSLVYYGDNTHLEYWLGHSLPVVLIGHIPGAGTFWRAVNEQTIERTPKRWKLEIPKASLFGAVSKDALRVLFEGSPAQQRLRRLAIDEPLMRHIVKGGKVSLELEDWVNKSLGRSPVLVYVYDEDGNETLSQEWGVYYTGFKIKHLAESLFPWARVRIDEEFYEEHEEDESEWDALSRATDLDNGVVYEHSENDIYPYAEHAGEVESYRLQLFLNELGKAYLVVSDHLAEALPKSPFDPDVLEKLPSNSTPPLDPDELPGIPTPPSISDVDDF